MDEIDTMSTDEVRALLLCVGAALRGDRAAVERERDRYRRARRARQKAVVVTTGEAV